jgi:nicotinate-nucleotide pyrophosphorylase (carboxylating)
LRLLEKYAVRVGGGHNHRFNLADAVLLKDNHLAALRSRGLPLADAIRTIKQRVPHTMKVEVEITSLEQIDAALAGEADIILLDNMLDDDMREAVRRIRGRALIECSGNVTLETVRERAETGVDLISAGALTHSARALDISLEIEVG